MSRFFFLVWTAETYSTIAVLFILYFVSEPESESKSESVPESESIKGPKSEPESESEQSHHDSALLPLGRGAWGDLAYVLRCESLQPNKKPGGN